MICEARAVSTVTPQVAQRGDARLAARTLDGRVQMRAGCPSARPAGGRRGTDLHSADAPAPVASAAAAMPHGVVLTENTLGARLTLRREVFELCLLPLAPLLPLLPDSPAALQVRVLLRTAVTLAARPDRPPGVAAACAAAPPFARQTPAERAAPLTLPPQSFQRRLLAHSVPSGSSPERRLVTTAAVADCLGVSEAVAACLLDVLDAAQPDAPPVGAAPPGEADMHAVLLLLFVNMYARPHVQSQLRNAGDVWPVPGSAAASAPAPAAPPAGEAVKLGGPASPTKPRRVSHPAGEHDEALQRAFVLRHLAALLPLLRSTPAAGAAG